MTLCVILFYLHYKYNECSTKCQLFFYFLNPASNFRNLPVRRLRATKADFRLTPFHPPDSLYHPYENNDGAEDPIF